MNSEELIIKKNKVYDKFVTELLIIIRVFKIKKKICKK